MRDLQSVEGMKCLEICEVLPTVKTEFPLAFPLTLLSKPPTHSQGANPRQRPVTPYDSRSFYLTTFFQITKQLPNSLSNRVSPSPFNASQDFPNLHSIMLGYTLVLPLAILASTASAQLNGLRATIPGKPFSLFIYVQAH